MATLSIDIPATVATRVQDAMCATYGYQALIPNPQNLDGPYIPNPQTKLQFVKQHVMDYIKQTVMAYEAQQAAAIASASASATANTDITLT